MITMDKQYRYRSPNVVLDRVLCVDRPSFRPILSMDSHGEIYSHVASGRICLGEEKDRDLIEVVPLWRDTLWVHADGRSTSGSMDRFPDWRRIEAVEVRKEGA